jgi:hypothetical protein
MSRLTTLLFALCLSASTSASTATPTPTPMPMPMPALERATLDAALAGEALARRPNRKAGCVRWWTCGPFKRDKPRLA